jgi:hypothetical protein
MEGSKCAAPYQLLCFAEQHLHKLSCATVEIVCHCDLAGSCSHGWW